jgi:hypothetical protein
MADVQYSKNSPYFQTKFHGKFLDIANIPSIPKSTDDVLFMVNKTYQYRPDLLAFDLYGDQGLWWVFAVRNPNTIQDPIFDMRIGNKIYLPKKDTLSSVLS